MNSKDKIMFDTSGRFKTDKNFKKTIIKNCSRLRQRSTDDHYTNRNKTIQHKISNIKRITNFKKINSLKENFHNSKEISNISKDNLDNLSIDMNTNIPEKRNQKILRSNIRKAFFIDFNSDNKKENTSKFEKNSSFIEVNKNKMIEKNSINENNKNIKAENKNENHNIKMPSLKKNNLSKYDTNDGVGIKELVIDIKDNNNFTKGNSKRSNSIRRIMNSLYYHSYTTDKKEKTKVDTTNTNNEKNINVNTEKEKKIENNYSFIPHSKKYNSVFNNNLYNEANKVEKITLNENSNSSYIYKRKKKKFGNIINSNNCIFNTYSTEDNSFINNNDNNKEYSKKNIESQNQNLIKVKIVYQKPSRRIQLAKESTPLNSTISVNQTVSRISKRRRILFEKKNNDDYENIKGNSREKKRQENLLTPIIRYNKEKKLIISSKDITIKRRFEKNNIKQFDNNIFNINKNGLEIENKKNNDDFINEFFDDIIELCNGIEERTIFDILTKNINKKYIIDYNKLLYEKKINEINASFDYCFKYFCIIIITFYFLSKDEILYKYNSVKIHLLFIQYIYSSLCYIGYQDLNSKNIKRFFQEYHFKKKVSIIQCTTSIIKLLFDEKEEYNSLNNVLKQLMINARITNVEDITKIINQTILFCFNTKSKGQSPFTYFKQRNSAINNIYNSSINPKKEEINNEEKYPLVPFIRTSMRKKFCLVLDLDETISHSLKLNFGYYFLLRPGVIEFLTELSELYEIIIFTSSPKIYADNIIDKIDEKNNLISHRLYKSHVIFERGKSVKKLNLIGRDLNKIIFVDNMKCNAKYNPKNLYLIPSWTDDIYDDELLKLKNKLKYIYSSGKFNDDITKAL